MADKDIWLGARFFTNLNKIIDIIAFFLWKNVYFDIIYSDLLPSIGVWESGL